MKKKALTRIRKDDNILVIAGNNRGKTGKVLRVLDEKVVVQGVNVRKKHVRPTRTSKGGIIEMEMPFHISNVQLCVDGDKPVKLHAERNAEGKKELYYKDGANKVVYRTLSR